MLAACGKISDTQDASLVDASPDAFISDASSDVASTDASMPDWNCASGLNVGYPCTSNGDCCSQNCFEGTCQRPACTSVGAACATSAECCSGECTTGACAALTCGPLGNACAKDVDCCSQACRGGVCVQPSFCGQLGDVCVTSSDCCTGICAKQTSGVLGRCYGYNQGCSLVAGNVCAGAFDGGPPLCGGQCCSRDCAPWGPLGVPICQPPSGCHPTGELCHTSADCCGPNEVCNLLNPDAGSGTCSNPSGCKPNGFICRTLLQCNATDMCCSGVVQTADTCQPDQNGTPRCSVPRDGGTCLDAGSACATSSDCCGQAPCVPSGDSGLTCYVGNCVPVASACTTDADCCVGTQCYFSGGATTGTCRALGTACALVGQLCAAPSDCCNAVPCSNGRCEW